MGVVLLLLGLAVGVSEAEEPGRFFVSGDGRLAIANVHSGERTAVRFRREDATYDPEALARIHRVFRSRDGRETAVSLRLIEVLSWVQAAAGLGRLELLSGYRSPDYNRTLKQRGRGVARGSLHTEGLAADVTLPRPELAALWHRLRDRECCGAGYYAKEGFLHVDVGRARFWEAGTSKVDEDLSAGNARLFARTEYDRYAVGEPIVVRLHSLTGPPVRVARRAEVVREAGDVTEVAIDGSVDAAGCLQIDRTGSTLRIAGLVAVARGHLRLATCTPRRERTPETFETNPIEVR